MSAYYQPGLHVGTCVGQWLDQPQGKSPYFALKFNIEARIQGEQEIPVEQNERTVYLYLTDKALDMTAEVLAFLGYDKDSLRWLDPAKDGFFNFAGKRVDLWCKHQEYEGETKEKWSISRPFPDATPLDEKEMRRLDTLFGKSIKTKKPTANGSTTPKPEPAAAVATLPPHPAPPPDDEIPF
jgi:hypothetical protein